MEIGLTVTFLLLVQFAGGTVISDSLNFATIEMQGSNGAHIDLKVGNVDFTGRVHANSSSMDFIHDVVKLKSKTSAHSYFVGTQGGSVELYHNNNKKLETAWWCNHNWNFKRTYNSRRFWYTCINK